jgi:hypothetical protein
MASAPPAPVASQRPRRLLAIAGECCTPGTDAALRVAFSLRVAALVAVAAAVLAVVPARTWRVRGGATMFVHCARSGEFRGGLLTLLAPAAGSPGAGPDRSRCRIFSGVTPADTSSCGVTTPWARPPTRPSGNADRIELRELTELIEEAAGQGEPSGAGAGTTAA